MVFFPGSFYKDNQNGEKKEWFVWREAIKLTRLPGDERASLGFRAAAVVLVAVAATNNTSTVTPDGFKETDPSWQWQWPSSPQP
jgi:hypothetical protein